MAVGRSGNWTKWLLDEMILDQMALDDMVIGRNGIGPSGHKPKQRHTPGRTYTTHQASG